MGALALTPWASLFLLATVIPNKNNVFTLLPTNTYYGLLALFSVTGSSLLVSSTSLMALYLSLELQSFAVYVLATLYRDSESATAAGLTYFLLGGLSSCFVLLGSSQLYASLGVASLEEVYLLLSVGNSSLTTVVAFSVTVLASGLYFKVAAAPFHQWAPDVYDRVPTIVTTWLQTMPKIAVLGLLLELTAGLLTTPSALTMYTYNGWTGVLMLVSLLSMVIGSVLGLAQVRVKRLLTYSTVAHVGFMLLALAVFSADAVASFLFYLAQYSVTSLGALMLLLAFGYVLRGGGTNTSTSTTTTIATFPTAHTTDISLLSELVGQVTSHPMLTLGLAAILFSIAGVPPFVGFFAKQGVLEASLAAHYGGVALLAVAASVVSASYYLKVVRLMHFDSVGTPSLIPTTAVAAASTSDLNPVSGASYPLTALHTFLLAAMVLAVSLYILLPSTLLDSTRSLALTMYLS
jgi:NADH-ubiquinone oxidoreductase chain 2